MPAAPTVTATARTGSILLSWDNVGTLYKVQKGPSWSTLSSQTGTTFSDTNVVAGQTYQYRVRASYDHGPDKISDVVSIAYMVKVIQPPVISGVASDARNTLSWSAVTGATKYNVRRNDSGTYNFIGTTPGTSYVDLNVANGSTYKYTVRSQDINGVTSADSNEIALTPQAPALPPLTAPSLSGTAGNTTAQLAWDAVSDADFYRLKRADGAAGSFVIISGDLREPIHQFTNSGLTNDQEYLYNLRAFRDNGDQSPNSNQVSITPLTPLPDTIPPTLAGIAGDGNIALTWNTTNALASINLQQGPTWGTIATLPATATSFNVTGLTNGNTYSFRLRCSFTYGVDRFSNEVTGTPMAPLQQVPIAPTLTGTAGSSQNVLSWGAVTSATSYRLRRWEGSTVTTVFEGNALTYTDTSVSNGTQYDYRVIALNSAGGSPFSNIVSLTPSAPVSSGIVGFAKAAEVTGGTGGTVYNVNNWGEFVTALLKSGPRIVKLHGTSDYNGGGQQIVLKNGTNNDLTVDGSDFSGQLTNFNLIQVKADNTIWRYLRLRTGEGATASASTDRRNITFNAGSGATTTGHVMEHCSLAWGPDVIASILNDCRNMTFQFCLFGPCMNTSNIPSGDAAHPNGYGPNMTVPGNNFTNRARDHARKVTFYKNFYVMNRQRNLKLEHGENVDAVNNVVYDFNQAPCYGNSIGVNFINNIFKKGPESASHNRVFEKDGSGEYPQYDDSTFWSGNLLWEKNGNDISDLQDWSDVTSAAKLSSAYDGGPTQSTHGSLTPSTANQALFDEVVTNAGCLPDDDVDTKMKNFARNGTSPGGYYNGPSTGNPPYPF